MDSIFLDKRGPSQLSRYLRNLIERIGETRNREQEEQIMQAQIASMRVQLAQAPDRDRYPDLLVKLIYFSTMGYDTAWASIFPINLAQSEDLYIKKMSYLLAALLHASQSPQSLLMHNTIIKDLKSENLYSIIIALTMLRYFLSEELSSQSWPMVKNLVKHNTAAIRRKALLCIIHFLGLENAPFGATELAQIIMGALDDMDPMVVFSGVSLIRSVIERQRYAEWIGEFRSLVPQLCYIQGKLQDHKYPQEYDYHQLPGPWIQMDVLAILGQLCRNHPESSQTTAETLQKVLKRCQYNTAPFTKSLILSAIRLFIQLKIPSLATTNLYQLAYTLIPRFFTPKNNNVTYFGLCVLELLSRIDKNILSEYQNQIVDCLTEIADLTLAFKAIKLFIVAASESNIDVLLAKLMNLCEIATDTLQRKKLLQSAVELIEKFSDGTEIFLRRMNELFYKFDTLITKDTVTNFIKILVEMADVETQRQGEMKGLMELAIEIYSEILKHFPNSALNSVGIWILGEFGARIGSRNRKKQQEQISRSREEDMLPNQNADLLSERENSGEIKGLSDMEIKGKEEVNREEDIRKESEELVKSAIRVLLNLSEKHLDSIETRFNLVCSLSKLIAFGTKKEKAEIREKLEELGSHDERSACLGIYTKEIIEMEKYSLALHSANDLIVDRKMTFLKRVAEKIEAGKSKSFILAKNPRGKQKGASITSLLDAIPEESGIAMHPKEEAIQFKLDRWSMPNKPSPLAPPSQFQATQAPKQTSFRGPKEIKKPRNPIDEKKIKLAAQIFGSVKKK